VIYVIHNLFSGRFPDLQIEWSNFDIYTNLRLFLSVWIFFQPHQICMKYIYMYSKNASSEDFCY
jgi:hypothetical protein